MKNIIKKTLMIVLLLQALFFVSPTEVRAQEECTPVTVEIDVKPVDDANKINLSSKGLLPVAVLTTDTFNAVSFAPQMAHLSDSDTAMSCDGAMAIRWTYTDVNSDRRPDLVFFFRVQDLNLTPDTKSVTLMAHGLYDATIFHIEGMDTVLVKS